MIKTTLPLDTDLQDLASIPKMKEEAREQCRLVTALRRHWRFLTDSERPIVFHIPNGGSRNALEGMNLKAAGVLAGIPDLQIILPNGKVLWVEMKAKSGKTSEAQDSLHAHMGRLQHHVIVAYSAEDALAKLREVLNV